MLNKNNKVITEVILNNVTGLLTDYNKKSIQNRQSGGYSGFPTKFPTLNEYVTLERGELVIIGAEQKQGKSIMMLNCAVDLLKRTIYRQ